MWGNLFPGIGSDSDVAQAIVAKKGTAHSAGCNMLGLKEGELMADLDPINQEFVLNCPHPSHDSVRQMFMIVCNGDRSENIQEGRLF